MARPIRELVAGGVYHAVARGNWGARIFRDDADYAEYLKLLAGVVKRFRWHVLAYCLMGNHVHLVIETPEPNLPAGMQWLHGKYGRYFNDRHELFGHLFQGRYKAVRQVADEQLLYVLRYVGLNPVEAGLCQRPRDYRWSSYGAVLESDPHSVAVDRLAWFTGAREGEDRLARYRELVEDEPCAA
jgi:REP element-mobilizing transposase RayT